MRRNRAALCSPLQESPFRHLQVFAVPRCPRRASQSRLHRDASLRPVQGLPAAVHLVAQARRVLRWVAAPGQVECVPALQVDRRAVDGAVQVAESQVRVLANLEQEGPALREELPAVGPSAIGVVRKGGGLRVAVGAISKSSKLRRLPITRRLTLRFPTARSLSSAERRPRSWVPSSTAQGLM